MCGNGSFCLTHWLGHFSTAPKDVGFIHTCNLQAAPRPALHEAEPHTPRAHMYAVPLPPGGHNAMWQPECLPLTSWHRLLIKVLTSQM